MSYFTDCAIASSRQADVLYHLHDRLQIHLDFFFRFHLLNLLARWLTFMNLFFQMLDIKSIYEIRLIFFCQHLSVCFTSRPKVSSRYMLEDFSTCRSLIFWKHWNLICSFILWLLCDVGRMKRENKNAAVHVCDRGNSFVIILLQAAVKYIFLT